MSHNVIAANDVRTLSWKAASFNGLVGILAVLGGGLILGVSLIGLGLLVSLAVGLVIPRRRLLASLIVGREFTAVFSAQRIMSWALRGSVVSLYLVGLPASLFKVVPLVDVSGILMIFLGLGFSYFKILDYLTEGRLSILQFLIEKSVPAPWFHWLKNGMETVAAVFEEFEIFVPLRRLLLGSSYAVLHGEDLDSDMRALADWLADMPKHGQAGLDSVSKLLNKARESEVEGFTNKPTLIERFERLPLSNVQYLLIIIIVILSIILGRAYTVLG